jgi:hypothetical protein
MRERNRLGLLIMLGVIAMLILKDGLRHEFGWSELPAFIVSLVSMLAVFGSVKFYLRIRGSET